MNFEKRIQERLEGWIEETFSEKCPLRFLTPPKVEMGDLTISSAFELGKRHKRNPREIAALFVERLQGLSFLKKVEIAGPGYINLFFHRDLFLHESFLEEEANDQTEVKVVVEHTNINPNKAAHIGHLRNAVLGDTLVRMLRAQGRNVEVQNYIDDTGVQVADVVYGLLELRHLSLEEVAKLERTDYYLWDLYVKVYERDDEESRNRRREVHRRMEEGLSPERDYAETVSLGVLRRHLETMARLGIGYDVLPRESDIIRLRFWESAFELLKESGVISYRTEGANQGCWVMEVFEDGENREKVIVKSNGAITYVGKDISYHLWKFGLLPKEFYYRKLDGRHWITTSSQQEDDPVHPIFGAAGRVYNVIDQRQSYLQNIVRKALAQLGHPEAAENLVHFSYEMVSLSKKAAQSMGFTVDEEKSTVEVSGRKGIGVKADDLIDELERRALKEVESRHVDFTREEKELIARQIACAALRYYMVKFSLNALIVFDFDEALKFEGETGPYLQYSLVRMKSLFRKYEETTGERVRDVSNFDRFAGVLPEEEENSFWEALLFCLRLPGELDGAVENLEPAKLGKYAFFLCQKFNYLYNNFSILKENDPLKRRVRLSTLLALYDTLGRVMDILALPKPERM